MPYLLYWFDTSLSAKEPWITLEPYDCFLSYEEGRATGLGDIPKALQNKILFNEERTSEDENILDSLQLLENAKSSGEPAYQSAKADHELFDVIPSAIQLQNCDDVFYAASSFMMDTPLRDINPTKDDFSELNVITRERGALEMPKEGDRVSIWWDGEKEYSDGTIVEVRDTFYNILYDDSDTEWLPLGECNFKIIQTPATKKRRRDIDNENVDNSDHHNKNSNRHVADFAERHSRLCKGKWTNQEDNIIIDAVTESGETPFTGWSDLGQRLPGRSIRQIRERWRKHLDPNIDRSLFSHKDDRMLYGGHEKLGNRWVEIADKIFNNTRSDVQLKNRWRTSAFKQFVADEFGPEAYELANSKTTSTEDSLSEEDQNWTEGASDMGGELLSETF